MGKALFLALSAAFFIGYSLIANALGYGGDPLQPITTPGSGIAGETTEEEGQFCASGGFLDVCDNPIWGPIIRTIAGFGEAVTNFATIFSGFFQLITFQAPGQSEASMVTLLIFGPLTFANGFIIFSAVRGSS